MGLLDNEMTIDPDAVADSAQNSIFAGAAGVLGIAGVFSIVEPFFAIFCLISIVCGLIVLFFARKGEIARVSVQVATASIFVGLFCGLAGVTYQTSNNWRINHMAEEVASRYMQALADGDRALAIKMVGLPQLVEDSESGTAQTSREQKAVRSFLADPAIQAVLNFGNSASWKSTGIQSTAREGLVTEIAVSFIDSNMTNPRPVVVTVKRMPPTKYTVETRNQWMVESIDLAPL